MRKRGVIIDRDSIAILKQMKDKALESANEKAEDSDEFAILYVGALLFARDRRLIDKNAAKRLYNQFQKDLEKSKDSETPAGEDQKK